jgi:hypothetical protein
MIGMATASGRPAPSGDHHQVAVGEVDQPEDPEDHREADSHQCVEAARAQRVDDLL